MMSDFEYDCWQRKRIASKVPQVRKQEQEMLNVNRPHDAKTMEGKEWESCDR